jgi:hypothetical protein
MLVTQAAGNIDDAPDGFLARSYAGFRDARFGSVAALAFHLGDIGRLLQDDDLWGNGGDPALPDLRFSPELIARLQRVLGPPPGLGEHVMVVDSAQPTLDAAAAQPSDFNFDGADVRAVGEGVQVLDNRTVRGTSFAAPQVAGLASLLWLLDDGALFNDGAQVGEPAAITAYHILNTADSTGAVSFIDAYAAVLALDRPGRPARVRRALVDANADGVFDHLDLRLFADAYRLDDPNAPTIPSTRDYSRFDLNGDDYTGGILIAPFDLDVRGLDANGLPSIEAVDATIEGYPISFNEAALSDLQILCYYAYAGAPAQPQFYDARQEALDERTAILGPEHCVGARVVIDAPSGIILTAPLEIAVEVPGPGGTFVPAPNTRVDLVPTCGTVTPESGTTDADGRFDSTVTLGTGCGAVTVQAIARAAENTPPLATSTVSLSSVTVIATISNGYTPGVSPGNTLSIFSSASPPTVPFEINCGEARLPIENFVNGTLTERYLVTGQFEAPGAPCVRYPAVYRGAISSVTAKLHISGEKNHGGGGVTVRGQAYIHIQPHTLNGVRYRISITDSGATGDPNASTTRIVREITAGYFNEYCLGENIPVSYTPVRLSCPTAYGDNFGRELVPRSAMFLTVAAEIRFDNRSSGELDFAVTVTIEPL